MSSLDCLCVTINLNPYYVLAINGGHPVIVDQFNHFNSFDQRELDSVSDLILSGRLSGFLGSKSDQFLGGPNVLALSLFALF